MQFDVFGRLNFVTIILHRFTILGVTTGEDIFPVTGKIVNRTAYEVLDDRCVNEEYPIRIKNCTLYLVYYLRPTTGCDTAYCFGLYSVINISD